MQARPQTALGVDTGPHCAPPPRQPKPPGDRMGKKSHPRHCPDPGRLHKASRQEVPSSASLRMLVGNAIDEHREDSTARNRVSQHRRAT